MDEIDDREVVYILIKNAPSFSNIKDWVIKVNMINKFDSIF